MSNPRMALLLGLSIVGGTVLYMRTALDAPTMRTRGLTVGYRSLETRDLLDSLAKTAPEAAAALVRTEPGIRMLQPGTPVVLLRTIRPGLVWVRALDARDSLVLSNDDLDTAR
jgi:hypothetical protein